MKRIRIAGFNSQAPDENSTPEPDFFELEAAEKRKQLKKIISAKYDPAGSPYGSEFRTTLELQYEFREMIWLSESAINEALNELGFEVTYIDGKPNWVLYLSRTDKEDYNHF